MNHTIKTQNILKECVKNVLESAGLHTNDLIDNIVNRSLLEIDEVNKSLVDIVDEQNETCNELSVGECCFCGGECNPMSQSCGYCSRGISGVAIGLTVPYELRKFVYK